MSPVALLANAPLLTSLDWLVIVLYAVVMLAVGWYYSRSMHDSDDYLLGGRNMKPWAVGMSMFASLFSTITYLFLPGEMVLKGPVFLASVLAAPIIFVVVGWLFIPTFMRLKAASGYELLETRLGLSVRLLGVLFFLSLRILWMAVIVYATVQIVLIPLTGLDAADTPWVCAVLMIITIIYTSMGGLRAVVVTDALQTLILLAGAIAVLTLVTIAVGGVGAWWPHQWDPSWGELHWVYDPSGKRSVLGAFFAAMLWSICTFGSDQVAIQRYMATRNINSARWMLAVAKILGVLIYLLLAGLGLALFSYFKSDPSRLPAGETLQSACDKLFPSYIVSGLPSGFSGLVIAGLLAAAMSSLSSGINSACAVISADLIDRYRPGGAAGNKLHAVWRDRIISVAIGVLVILLSGSVAFVQGNLLELAYKLVNLLTAPLFGLFFMALFVRRATAFSTYVGAVVGVVVVVGINYWSATLGRFEWVRETFGDTPPIDFFWAMPLSLTCQIVAGVAVSYLLPLGKPRPMLT
ncbi:MAG: sodium/solute symporter [Phycisphaeraceae bacterium]|nr:sodium/solute symporter [Phycisphaeraceae bacterium]